MIAPPLAAERLLEALTAKSAFRDGILGDLAEEFAERAATDGEAAARRWYYREAVGVVPHLMYDWARTLRFREGRRLINVVVGAYFVVSLLVSVVAMVARAVADTFGTSVILAGVSSGWGAQVADLAWVAVIAMLTGYCAASLDKRTPLASAILIGVLCASTPLMNLIFANVAVSGGHIIAGMAMLFVGATMGGMLWVVTTRFDNRQGYLDWRGKFKAS